MTLKCRHMETEAELRKIDDQVSTHGNSAYLLKEKDLKCRHMLPVALNNTKNVNTCS